MSGRNGNGRQAYVPGAVGLRKANPLVLAYLMARLRWHACALCGERFRGRTLPLHHRLRHTTDFWRRNRAFLRYFG